VAAANVAAWVAEVIQQRGVGAASLFKNISQDREMCVVQRAAEQGPLRVDRFGQALSCL